MNITRMLWLEQPDTKAVVDFADSYKVVLEIQKDGRLWVEVTGVSDQAPILLDTIVGVDVGGEDDELVCWECAADSCPNFAAGVMCDCNYCSYRKTRGV